MERINAKTEGIQSDEELYTAYWLEELKDAGYIKEFILQPASFKLADAVVFDWIKDTSTKTIKNRFEDKKSNMLEAIEYTADAHIMWDMSAMNLFFTVDKPRNNKCKLLIAHIGLSEDTKEWVAHSYIEVKPVFDQNNMEREFKIKQKWVYQKYNTFINLVVPQKFFPHNFTPKMCIATMIYVKTTKTKRGMKYKGDSKITWNVKTLKEYTNA